MSTLENEDSATQRPRPVDQDDDPTTQAPELNNEAQPAVSEQSDESVAVDEPSTDAIDQVSASSDTADEVSSSLNEQIQAVRTSDELAQQHAVSPIGADFRLQ